jgi:hypothetical protein
MLKSLSRGYISYVKGDNPITFPKALLPSDHYGDVLYEPGHLDGTYMLPYLDYKGDIVDTNIMDDFHIMLGSQRTQFRFDLVNCPMEIYQFQAYISLMRAKNEDRSMDGADTWARMVSNIAFPMANRQGVGLFGDDYRKVYGNKGFNEVFAKSKVTLPGTSKVKKEWTCYKYKDEIFRQFGHWLMIKEQAQQQQQEQQQQQQQQQDTDIYNLAYYSKKLHNLITYINDSPGIAYVYSEFVEAGAVITALALEANGWLRYTPELFSHYVNNDTGLPRPDIINTHPQCKMLHVKDPKLVNHYRCTYCGKLYKDCTKETPRHPHGKFRVSTYVIITGKVGGIKEIAYVTSGNQAGDKIKAVIGTKVTGQGVDLKWIRQVHILDPWHNNTRIFQAIGRGLRHCSHADLQFNQRDVTIFKYSSSPLNGGDEMVNTAGDIDTILDNTIEGNESFEIKYRDLLTETVDEHMYRRVVRKDILIKHIERSLKESAMDCELNKKRNQFGTDLDYSRNCDYALCEYKCDSTPIQYIRSIVRSADGQVWSVTDGNDEEIDDFEGNYSVSTLRKIPAIDANIGRSLPDEATNQEVWDYYKSKAYKIIETGLSSTILLDLPLGDIDSSTYDIYFTAPQVDKAIKIITRLFHSVQAMSLKRMVYLVQKSNPTLESKFVFVAINKLVGHPPFIRPQKIIDKFGRSGYIIVHNGLYIYQPQELTDKRIPMYYRQQPVTIKTRFYNMNDLAPKALPSGQQADAAILNTEDIDNVLHNVTELDFTSVIDRVAMYTELDRLLMKEHVYLFEKAITDKIGKIDKIVYMLEYYLRSGAAYFYPYVTDKDRGDGTIEFMINKLLNGNAWLAHVMSPAGSDDVRVYVSNTWEKKNYSDLVDLKNILMGSDGGDAADNSYENIMYPTVDGPERKLYPRLNTTTDIVGEDETILYGFISKTMAHRGYAKANDTGATIFNRLARHYKEYPSRKDIKEKAAFKILDHSKYVPVKTLEMKHSQRSNLKGMACTSITIGDSNLIYNKIMHVMERYKDDIHQTMYPDVDDFITDLKQQNLRLSVPAKIERVLRILDYYYILGKKWFLNPIQVEFYRPIVNVTAPVKKIKK